MSVIDYDVEHAVTIFTALANEIRVKALLEIQRSKRPLHITAVAKVLGVEYAALYRHIKLLKKCGLLVSYEVGRSQVLVLQQGDLIQQLIVIANKISEAHNIDNLTL